MICSKCGEDSNNFYVSNMATCKECVKKGVRANRKNNIEHYREFDRKRALLPQRVKAREEYAKTEKGKDVAIAAKKKYADNNKEKIRESNKKHYMNNIDETRKQKRKYFKNNKEKVIAQVKKYRENNPEKYKAHVTLNSAIKNGSIIKPEKCHCGSNVRIEGHHPDYSKPLEVIWLCSMCHKEEHKRIDNEQ